MAERYEALVVGGGMAGLPLALRAARHGRVALVERELLGGTCLNRGCIPTKTMIASAKVAHQVRRAADFGVETSGPKVDIGAVIDRKDRVVDSIRSGSYRAVERRQEVDLIEDEGRFVGGRRFRVGGVELEADRIFLNAGTRDAIPPIEGLDEVPHLTSRSMLELRELPEQLIVVGGGYIGCEFGQMLARFGSQVTVVQRDERLLPREEPELSAIVRDAFEAEGIAVLTGTECVGAAGRAGEIRISCEGAERGELSGTHLLLAAGRTPNTDTLGLEELGLEPGEGGYLAVDNHLRTEAEDVWALGDLRGGPMFTHTARDDADAVYRHLYRGEERSIAGRIVPHAVFVDPEVASVGLSETEAREAGHEVV
ncbi:MAG: dihydrolipoamide dehydrogenase [Solirubrobacterales bacterium]|nr:dihydrolipoamide dehydrogenase [Solirubrobacterales bacterium]